MGYCHKLFRTWLFLFLVLLFASSSLIAGEAKGFGRITLFADDFESYSVGSAKVCLGPPDSTSNCLSPPHKNTGLGQFPEYWQLASSGTCANNPATGQPPGRGGCVTWGIFEQAGPNSIFAVVTEKAHSGTKSLKLGASDYAFDKSQASIWLDPNQIPASGTLTYEHAVWFSNGINTNYNHYQMDVGGLIIRYVGSTGKWGVMQNGKFNFLIKHPLSTQAWHVIDINIDLATKTFSSLVIDGVTQTPSIRGMGVGSWHTVINNQKTVIGIMSWINPALDNQSIHSLGQANGYYAYVDDVLVTIT